MTGKQPSKRSISRTACTALLLCLAAACGGRGPASNSYIDTNAQASARTLPEAPAPQHYDWMTGSYELASGNAAVNFSEAVLQLGIGNLQHDDTAELSRALTGLYPDMHSAMLAAADNGCGLSVLPSVDLLDVYGKYTDDRVLAALELELSGGSVLYPGGQQQWLQDLLAAIPLDADPARRNARALLATAIRLGGGQAVLEPQVESIAAGIRSRFLSDKVHSTVTGFYTQSEELKAVFLRDRLLQTEFGKEPAGSAYFGNAREELDMLAEIDRALSGSIGLRDAYNDLLAVRSAITNPAEDLTLNALATANGAGVAIFPHAASTEEGLFNQMPQNYPGTPMDYLRENLLAGNVDLAPRPDSGWYGYQQYALETLLLPERADEFPKLQLSPSYVLRLDNAFKGTITQRRETHVKELPAAGETASIKFPPLAGRPLLNLEPAPTVYLRTARAYRNLGNSLRDLLLRRPDSGSDQLSWLLTEIDSARQRYFALHCLSCNDLGQPIGINPAELDELELSSAVPPDAEFLASCCVAHDPRFSEEQQQRIGTLCSTAADWLVSVGSLDQAEAAFLSYDPRVSVPASIRDDVVHNWSVIGVRLLLLETSFSTVPQAWPADAQLQAELDRHFAEQRRSLIPVYEYAGFDTRAPISREQFRNWCDQSRSKEEFMLVVNAYSGSVGKSWLEQYGFWIVILICLALFRDRLLPGVFGKKPPAGDSGTGTAPPAAD